jgi:hypothetical protein
LSSFLYFFLFLLHQGASGAQGVDGRGFFWDAFWRPVFAPLGAGGTAAFYYLTLAALYGIYVTVLKQPTPGRGAYSPWVAGAATGVLLLITPPSRSTDVYAYLAHGHNGAADLAAAHAKEIYPAPSTPYLDELGARTGLVGHGPTPYGPLWTHTEIWVYRASRNDVAAGVFLFKALSAAAFAGTVIAGAAIAGPAAGLAILLNPFLLTELVAEGHNDAWMVFFCGLALLYVKRQRLTLAVLSAAAGVLTKYVPALLAGPMFRFLLSSGRPWVKAVAAGGLIAGAAAALLYYPLWIGAATFQGVRENADAIPAFARLFLKNTLKAYPLADFIFRGGLWVLFLSFWAGASSRARSFEGMVLAGALVLLAYLLFFPAFVWPWYLAVPVTLILLLPGERFRPWALLFSLNASLVAPVWSLYKNGQLSRASADYLQHGLVPGFTIFIFLGLVAAAFRAPFPAAVR